MSNSLEDFGLADLQAMHKLEVLKTMKVCRKVNY